MRIRRVILGALWVLSLVAISFFGGSISYGFFFAITLLPCLSLFYIACVWLCYKVYQEIGSRNIVCGQSVPYYFVLRNENKFAFASIGIHFFSDFSYVEKLPGKIEYELLPQDRYRYETSFVCRYRGEYEVGIKEVVISDFLGLFRIRCAVKETKKVIVAPRLIRLHELKSISDISAMLQREAVAMATEQDVITREYVQGDPLKQIHWKATACQQKLMSRKLTGEEKRGAELFFDTCRYEKDPKSYLPIENRILEIVLALVFFLTEKNIPIQVHYGQGEMKQVFLNKVGDFKGFYERIKALHFDKDENAQKDFTQILYRGLAEQKQVLFLVLHKISYAILEQTHPVSESGVIVVIYVVTEENIEAFCRLSNENRKIIAVAPQEEPEVAL